MTRVDVHQHLWTEPLVEALARRHAVPRARVQGRRVELDLPEGRSEVLLDDVAERRGTLADDGLDRAMIVPSTATGAELLDADGADALLDAYARGALAAGPEFGAWASIPLRDAEPRRVDAALDEGFAGLCLPAPAVAAVAALDRLGPVLERLERRGAPLLVHPGPAGEPRPGDPSWWPALADYVTSLHAAWLAWVARGRAQHPRLRVCFVALAGLAPLHAERLQARGGPGLAHDPLTFFDTSSYGSRAIAAMAAAVGPEQLVHGSDRPVVAAVPAPQDAFATDHPRRLLEGGA